MTTYKDAERIYKMAFNNSQPYLTCKAFISDLSNASLVNCISDVMVFGCFTNLFY